MAAQQQRQTVTSSGIFNHEKHVAASTQSNITITAKGMCTKSSTISAASQVRNSLLLNICHFSLLYISMAVYLSLIVLNLQVTDSFQSCHNKQRCG